MMPAISRGFWGVCWMSRGALLLAGLCLTGCMSMIFKAPESEIPLSLNDQLRGYRVGPVIRHISREIWVYHLLGLPQLPLWTREGLPADDLLTPFFKQYAKSGQGVIRLRIKHGRTPLTWTATLMTLGLISATAVNIEADIVELQPLF